MLITVKDFVLCQLKVDVREVEQEGTCFRHLTARVEVLASEDVVGKESSEQIRRDFLANLVAERLFIFLLGVGLVQSRAVSHVSGEIGEGGKHSIGRHILVLGTRTCTLDEQLVRLILTIDFRLGALLLTTKEQEILLKQLINADEVKSVRLDKLDEIVQRNLGGSSNENIFYQVCANNFRI